MTGPVLNPKIKRLRIGDKAVSGSTFKSETKDELADGILSADDQQIDDEAWTKAICQAAGFPEALEVGDCVITA